MGLKTTRTKMMIRQTENSPPKIPAAVFHLVLLHLSVSAFSTSAAAKLVATGHSPSEESSDAWSPGDFPEI